jgi:hypothetical protein
MKKTLKQRIRDWLNTDDSDISEKLSSSRDDSGFATDESIRFDITSARGGIIVNVRNYDPKTDRNQYTVHVIHDDQNVAESIAHIVSLEMLKH